MEDTRGRARRACLLLAVGILAALAILACRPNDGGWYLLAASDLAAGKVPHRDFPFPHPPLVLLPFLPAVLFSTGPTQVALARVLALLASAIGIALAIPASFGIRRHRGVLLILASLALLDPWSLGMLALVKAYPITVLTLGAALLAARRSCPGLAGFALGLGAGARLSLLAATPALAWTWRPAPPSIRRALLGMAAGFLVALGPWFILAPRTLPAQLYLPLVGSTGPNAMTARYVRDEVDRSPVTWARRVAGSLARTASTHAPLLFLLLLGWRGPDGPDECLAKGALLTVGLAHLLAWRPYDDYQLLLAPCVALLAARGADRFLSPSSPDLRRSLLFLGLLAIPSWTRFLHRLELTPEPYLLELARAGKCLAARTHPGDRVLALDPYLLVASRRSPVGGLELGRFGIGAAGPAGGVDPRDLLCQVASRAPAALALPDQDPELATFLEGLTSVARASGYRRMSRLPEFGENRVELTLWALPEATSGVTVDAPDDTEHRSTWSSGCTSPPSPSSSPSPPWFRPPDPSSTGSSRRTPSPPSTRPSSSPLASPGSRRTQP